MKTEEENEHSITNKTAKTAATSNFRDSEAEEDNKLDRSGSINDEEEEEGHRLSGHF